MRNLIFKAAFLLLLTPQISACESKSKLMEKKVINYSDKLTFAIPKHWQEENDPSGGGMFYEAGQDTGTLRVNLLTVAPPKPISSNSAVEALTSLKQIKLSDIEQLPNGNAIAKSVTHSIDQGKEITQFLWLLAGPIPPKNVRVAVFSYTVLMSAEKKTTTIAEVQFLEDEIRSANFRKTVD